MTNIKNLEEKLKRDKNAVPEVEGENGSGVPTTPILTRLDAVEKTLDFLEKGVNFVQDTNRYILIVLFAALIALILTAISGLIQATNSRRTTEIEFIKSVQDLKNEVNNFENNLPRIILTPIPTIVLPSSKP